MRAAAILGLGCSLRDLTPFQQGSGDEFSVGLPATGEGLDAVLILGGDGTVHRHLGALVQLGLPVLVVPAGSGNDFARALGLKSARASRQAWQQFAGGGGEVRAIDLGLISARAVAPAERTSQPDIVNSERLDTRRAGDGASPVSTGAAFEVAGSGASRYFACVAGIGLDAEIARRANGLPRWLRRSGGYALALPPALVRYAPFPMKVFTSNTAPGVPFELQQEGPMMLAAFANTPFYGDGMKIAPGARLDDGALDVCLVEGMNAFRLLCLFPSVYSGRHLRVKRVHYFKATAARVETDRPMDVYADGEFVCRTPAEFSVARGALRVIVP
jgi:diacylglycerol kinase (ATP)